MNLIETALAYRAAGLCVLPARLADKRPALPSWKEFQKRLPTEQEIRAWFAGAEALCTLCGEVSGHLEMIDFDQKGELLDAWLENVCTTAPQLLDKLVIERSQNQGSHVIYRCAEAVCGNLRLAERIVTVNDASEVVLNGKRYRPRKAGDRWTVTLTLIETRGEGGLFLCAPSPGYELKLGQFEQLAVVTPEERDVLLSAAYALNECLPQPDHSAMAPAGESGRPGDEFNRQGDVRALLKKHGWRLYREGENEHWCRPGKERGTSATLKNNTLYVFSSNAAPFEQNKAYSPFGVYAHLEHEGDFHKAATALREAGYGRNDADSGVDLSKMLAQVQATGEPGEPDSNPAPEDPGPFPERLLRVPGFVEEVVSYSLATAHKPQPVLSLAGALCLQAVLAARKVCDPRGNRTNLYILGVAESGCGKDHARKVNKHILYGAGLGFLEGNEDFASDSGLLKAVEMHPALLFQIDEIGRMLKTVREARSSHLFNISTALIKLYSSADTVFRGKAYADHTRNVEIQQPCVSLFGLTIPSYLYDALTLDNLVDGFLARLMVFEAGCNPPRQRVPQRPVPDSILRVARWWGDFGSGGNLLSVHPKPITIEYAEDAGDIFDALAKEADAAHRKGDPAAQALWARAEEKACRLALIFACSAHRENLRIGTDAARWGCELAHYLTRKMLYQASRFVSEGDFDAKQKRILRILQHAGGRLSANQLCRKTQAFSMRERQELFENMLATGQLKMESVNTQGRTKVNYVLS